MHFGQPDDSVLDRIDKIRQDLQDFKMRLPVR